MGGAAAAGEANSAAHSATNNNRNMKLPPGTLNATNHHYR